MAKQSTQDIPAITPNMPTDDKFGAMAQAITSLATTVGLLATKQDNLSSSMANLIGDREALAKHEREDLANYERIRGECNKSAQQRTQEAADSKWARASHRWQCALVIKRAVIDPNTGKRISVKVPDLAWPVVSINADSMEEAGARYQQICNIKAIDGSAQNEPEIRVVPEGEKIASRLPSDEYLPDGVMSAAG